MNSEPKHSFCYPATLARLLGARTPVQAVVASSGGTTRCSKMAKVDQCISQSMLLRKLGGDAGRALTLAQPMHSTQVWNQLM